MHANEKAHTRVMRREEMPSQRKLFVTEKKRKETKIACEMRREREVSAEQVCFHFYRSYADACTLFDVIRSFEYLSV